MKLDEITIFNDIRERLEAITPEQIEIVGNRLGAPDAGEIVQGQIAPATRALHVLVHLLRAEINLERAKGMQLMDKELVSDHQQRAMIADQINDVVEQLQWAQARNDTGFWKPVDIGIRNGWVLVEMRKTKNPMEGFLMKLGMHPETEE